MTATQRVLLIVLAHLLCSAPWAYQIAVALHGPSDGYQTQVEIVRALSLGLVCNLLVYFLIRRFEWRRAGLREATRLWRPGSALPVLVALGLGVPIVGFSAFSLFSEDLREDKFADLKAIADLKASQVELWMAERRGDGEALRDSADLTADVEVLATRDDDAARARITNRLQAVMRAYGYEQATLLAPDGRAVLRLGEPGQLPHATEAMVAIASYTGMIVNTGLIRDRNGRLHLDFLVPFTRRDAGRDIAVATLVLHVSPERFLFPLLRTWPMASESGETVLVRREGDEIAFLNDLRHARNAALTIRRSMRQEGLVAREALLANVAGQSAGIDYHGTRVLAAYRPVFATDWMLIAKIDADEAMAPARSVAYWTAFASLLAAVVVAVALLMMLQGQRSAARRLVERNEEEAIARFFTLPFVGMAITAPDSKRWSRINDRLCQILGYEREELTRMTWTEITHPDDLDKDVAAFEAVMRGESNGYAMDKRFLRKDGELVHASIDVQCVRRKDGTVEYFLATVEDITLRVRTAERARALTRLYAVLARCNEAIVRSKSAPELYEAVCRTVVEQECALMAWIGRIEPASGRVVVQAQHGPGAEYVASLNLSIAPDDPASRGPTGLSMRENRAYWCDDFMHDPSTTPWRERAAAHGWRASCSLPLCIEGRPVGNLSLYVDRVGAFDAETRGLLVQIAEDIGFALEAFERAAQRDRAVTATGESERRFRRAIENAPIPVMMYAETGAILSLNQVWLDLTGYDRKDIPDANAWLALARGVPVADVRELFDLIGDGPPGLQPREYDMRCKDGTLRTWAISTSMLGALEDGTRIALSMAFDLTERKRQEAEIRKLSLAVEQSPESIVITNLAAEIEYVNQAFLDITGYSRDEVIGRNPRVLHSGATSRETFDDLWATLARGDAWRGQFVNKRKDGSEYTEFAIIAPVRQPDGAVTHYLAIKDDISEKKRMGEELDRHRRHLEELVELRTTELAEARLRAESANLAKSAFLANMSHEIRTPMNAILGLTYLLQQSQPSPEQSNRLDKIVASGRHLLSLIDDILDLSKIEAGRMSIEAVDFDLRAEVEAVVAILRTRAEEKGIGLASIVDAGLPAFVRGDPVRLRQVLFNLGSNAVKFTPAGRVDIRVVPVAAAEDGLRVRFEVSDTGIGIADEQIGHLFEPFQQADGSTTRRFGGTGLGLAISRRLVDLMRGRLDVTTAPGRGSTFHFEVPLEPGKAPAADTAPADMSAVARGLDILLVEDDPINQEVAGDLLRGSGHRVDVAGDGAQAVERAARADYDVILMDLQMPVMDGIGATAALRATARHARTPIIALTANAFAEDRARCLAVGMNDFIAKPVDPERMFATIARHAAAGAGETGATGAAPPRAATSADATPPALARYGAIEGLDVAAGLRPVMGRLPVYEGLLARFAQTHRGDAATFAAALRAGRREDAMRLAHTLRGVAATIGAMPLATLAGALEADLRRPDGAVGTDDARIGALDATLARLCAALDAALPAGREAARAAAPVSPDRARETLERLRALLAEDNVKSISVVEEEQAALRAALGARFDAVAREVRGFRFDAALRILEEHGTGGATGIGA